MTVEINVKYDGDLRCTAVHKDSNASIITDAPKDNGGKGEAFSPTDLVGAALGSCILTIMGLYAQREKIDMKGTTVNVIKEMSAKPPRRISEARIKVVFPKGMKVTDEQKAKLEHIVEACPVKQSLHPELKLSTEFVY